MSDAIQEKIYGLIDAARYETKSSAIPILEHAIALADQHLLDELAYHAREELIESAIFGGYPEKALVAFSWCLAKSDEDPIKHSELNLLWTYKWVGENISIFPQITRAQLESTLEDMKARYVKNNASLRPYWMEIMRLRQSLGDDSALAEQAFLQFQKARRDQYADCRACEENFVVSYQLYHSDYAAALKSAAAILSGQSRCAEVPHHTYADLLLPALDAGDARAAEFFQKGYRLCQHNRDFASQVGIFLAYKTLVGDLAQAIKMLERHLFWAVESSVPRVQLDFYASVEGLFRTLAKDRETLKLQIPKGLDLPHDENVVKCAAAGDWFGAEVDRLAALFDARNGNDSVSQEVQVHRARYAI